jgi:type IV secretion system protein VirB1
MTLAAIVQHESGGHPLAIHDNTTATSYWPQTEAEAIAWAKSLIALGHSVDLGLGQINHKNLAWLGQSVETIFKPCANLTAAQGVLLAAWRQSDGSLPNTLSIYSTGKINDTGASYAAAIYAQVRPNAAPAAAPVVPAIPNGTLPAWVSRELPAGSDAALTPEAFRAATGYYRVARTPARPSLATAAAASPAESALRPDIGDLRPGKGGL